ncbi:hypothetical protein K1719_015476 [Acacia pycnantha]|nr:hypothetical protein K1719_015476 [Acacia pycnantha]
MAHHRRHSASLGEEIKSSSSIADTRHATASIGRINEMVAEARLSKKNPLGHTPSTASIHSAPIFFSSPTGRRIQSPSSSSSSSYRSSIGITALSSSPSTSSKSDSGGKITDKKKEKKKSFACVGVGTQSCKNSRRSPEHRRVDEEAIIQRARVVESLPQFWADKYQPTSFHKQETQLLKKLACLDELPHILLKGPSGSGKRALAMALLREIYGEECGNLSHNIRYFPFKERSPTKVSVPITFSCHHVELNVKLERNAKYALMGLVKEMSCIYAVTPQDTNLNIKSDCQVLVLYEVDKAEQDIQQIISWIINCHSQICKLILCCQDDVDILESVRNLFKVIQVHPPTTPQIMEVLFEIAKKEDIHLPENLAAIIAAKSNQNLRQAIMALEACKAFKYPFLEEQPISIGWEDVVIEIALEIIADPSKSCLISVRGKFQKLMEDFVHPKLILRRLVEELLKNIEDSLKRELYYWHAYYDKRLPPGTSAFSKLAEFVAKFMSIYKKSFVSRQYV